MLAAREDLMQDRQRQTGRRAGGEKRGLADVWLSSLVVTQVQYFLESNSGTVLITSAANHFET